MVHLDGRIPGSKVPGGVHAHDPIVTDEGGLGVPETEPGVHLWAKPQRDRVPPSMQEEEGEVLAERHLGFPFPPELAIPPAGRQHSPSEAVYAR